MLYGIKDWSISHSGRSTPSERGPCSHWVELLFRPSVGLDAVEKRTNHLPFEGTYIWLTDTNMVADEYKVDTGLIIIYSQATLQLHM
jgi:hypothetical protein